MISIRQKKYLMFFLLYCSSLYHIVFSTIIMFNNDTNFLFRYYNVQECKLRIDVLPILGFETFSLMTLFMVFDYLIRKKFNSRMTMSHFLDAFLFSHLAYIPYIYRFVLYLSGIHAFTGGVLFFLIDIPLLVVGFPLSLFLFRKRLTKLMADQSSQDDGEDDKDLVTDYLIFWTITLIGAVMSYILYR